VLGLAGTAGGGADHGPQRETSPIWRDQSTDRAPRHAAPPADAARGFSSFSAPPPGSLWEAEDLVVVRRGPGHTAEKSLAVAASLAIELVWLPKQCSELNAMDHLWKELKRQLAANRQFRTIDEGAEHAEQWVLGLSPQQARRKAGILSKNYWLKVFSKHFCRPTYSNLTGK
jgi:transposase